MNTSILSLLNTYYPDTVTYIKGTSALQSLETLLNYATFQDINGNYVFNKEDFLISLTGQGYPYIYFKHILTLLIDTFEKTKIVAQKQLGVFRCIGMISETLKTNQTVSQNIISPSSLITKIQASGLTTLKVLDLSTGGLLPSDLKSLADNLKNLNQSLKDSLNIIDLSFNKITSLDIIGYNALIATFPNLKYIVLLGNSLTPTYLANNIIFVPYALLNDASLTDTQRKNHIAYYNTISTYFTSSSIIFKPNNGKKS